MLTRSPTAYSSAAMDGPACIASPVERPGAATIHVGLAGQNLESVTLERCSSSRVVLARSLCRSALDVGPSHKNVSHGSGSFDGELQDGGAVWSAAGRVLED